MLIPPGYAGRTRKPRSRAGPPALDGPGLRRSTGWAFGARAAKRGAVFEAAPLVVTLDLDEPAAARFEALRRRLFSPERNLIPAHLTLFHQLPGTELARVLDDLRAACARPAPALRVTGVRSLGRGVAYAVESAELLALRAALARTWSAWLTPQDRQGFRPHVVVQNKVDAATARHTLESLAGMHVPWDTLATGVHVWRYLGGPWSSVASVPFARSAEHLL